MEFYAAYIPNCAETQDLRVNLLWHQLQQRSYVNTIENEKQHTVFSYLIANSLKETVICSHRNFRKTKIEAMNPPQALHHLV